MIEEYIERLRAHIDADLMTHEEAIEAIRGHWPVTRLSAERWLRHPASTAPVARAREETAFRRLRARDQNRDRGRSHQLDAQVYAYVEATAPRLELDWSRLAAQWGQQVEQWQARWISDATRDVE